MIKQKIKIFSSSCKGDVENDVNDWLNNENNKGIKVLNIAVSNKNQDGGYTVVVHYEYEENFSNKNAPEKITIESFFENCEKNKLCVHCDTPEKARIFTLALLEFKNATIGPLSSEQVKNFKLNWTEFWYNFKGKTCYTLNGYCYKNWFLKNEYKIYEFEDIIFDDKGKK